MNNMIRFTSTIYLYLLVIPYLFAQTNYFVSKTGNNANIGSSSSPWLTIQYGIYQLSPGDTLNIKAGTYFEKVDLDVSGTALAWITIRNFENDVVVMNASTFSDDAAIIWTDDAYLRIEGLNITKNEFNFASGIALQGTAHHIHILNNKISEINFSTDPGDTVIVNTNAVPLSVYADNPSDSIHDILIKGNEVFNNRTGYSENISCGGNFTDFLIEDNIVHDNTNIGIDMGGNYGTCPTPSLDHARRGIIRNNIVYNCDSPYSTAAGIYIDGGHNIVVENNLCYQNGYGGEIGCEENGTTENIIFRNNVFHHNIYAGMHMGGYDENTTGNVLNARVYNNTFYLNDSGINSNGELLLTKSVDCEIFNNIFFISSQNVYLYAYRTQTNLTLDYNLVYNVDGNNNIIETTTDGENANGGNSYTGLSDFYTATGYGTHSIFGNPMLINPGGDDFHISVNSPARDQSDPSHSPDPSELDLDHEARGNGLVDIGVDEYYATLNVVEIDELKGNKLPSGIQLVWNIDARHLDKIIIEKMDENGDWISFMINSSKLDQGEILDTNPLKGENTYRLKKFDITGDYTYSSILVVQWSKGQSVNLFPNPSRGYVYIESGVEVSIKVKNMLGQEVFSGVDIRQFDIKSKGNYLVFIYDKLNRILKTSLLVIN